MQFTPQQQQMWIQHQQQQQFAPGMYGGNAYSHQQPTGTADSDDSDASHSAGRGAGGGYKKGGTSMLTNQPYTAAMHQSMQTGQYYGQAPTHHSDGYEDGGYDGSYDHASGDSSKQHGMEGGVAGGAASGADDGKTPKLAPAKPGVSTPSFNPSNQQPGVFPSVMSVPYTGLANPQQAQQLQHLQQRSPMLAVMGMGYGVNQLASPQHTYVQSNDHSQLVNGMGALSLTAPAVTAPASTATGAGAGATDPSKQAANQTAGQAIPQFNAQQQLWLQQQQLIQKQLLMTSPQGASAPWNQNQNQSPHQSQPQPQSQSSQSSQAANSAVNKAMALGMLNPSAPGAAALMAAAAAQAQYQMALLAANGQFPINPQLMMAANGQIMNPALINQQMLMMQAQQVRLFV